MDKRKNSSELSWRVVVDSIHYCKDSGIFRWRIARGRQAAGSVAGTPKDGYVNIVIDSCVVRAHRLAYFIVNGHWPREGMLIDHINFDRSDNRWCNLRLASPTENSINQPIRKDNTSGHTGVYVHKTNGRFYPYLQKNGKNIKLGGYATFDEAVAVRMAAEVSMFGEFRPER